MKAAAWTIASPTKPGWYWCQTRHGIVLVVQVIGMTSRRVLNRRNLGQGPDDYGMQVFFGDAMISLKEWTEMNRPCWSGPIRQPAKIPVMVRAMVRAAHRHTTEKAHAERCSQEKAHRHLSIVR